MIGQTVQLLTGDPDRANADGSAVWVPRSASEEMKVYLGRASAVIDLGQAAAEAIAKIEQKPTK